MLQRMERNWTLPFHGFFIAWISRADLSIDRMSAWPSRYPFIIRRVA